MTRTNETNPVRNNKKKRLSRKEQKARKKQKKKAESNATTETATGNNETTATTVIPSTQNDDDKPPMIDTEEEIQASYIPTPIPVVSKTNNGTSSNNNHQAATSSVGKWFPKAIKIKHAAAPLHDDKQAPQKTTTSLLLFYQYVTPPWTPERVDALMQYLTHIGQQDARPHLAGRIRIAREGLNCTLTAMDSNGDRSAYRTLRHFVLDLQHFDPHAFAQTDFKYTNGLPPDRHFAQLLILPVQELVYYGLPEPKAPLSQGGQHVSPLEFHQMLAGTDQNKNEQQKETVVIDVRNHYEAAIGRFDGQEGKEPALETIIHNKNDQEQEEDSAANNNTSTTTVAKYVDPKMRKSTDFPTWLAQPETKELLQNKRVLMFCTGGVRCERASAHLKQTYQHPDVYQLQGGVEKYLQQFPDGGFWRGKNFTFDKREAISAENKNGDGGVVRKQKKNKSKESSSSTSNLPGCECVVCHEPWDRYIGKKKCRTCGVPILMCDSCLSQHKEAARCPLCVEQHVTVQAEQVEYTDNGCKAAVTTATKGTVAPTVLKWGGGHAHDKKARRKFRKKSCKFGVNCTRADCFFAHPERKGNHEGTAGKSSPPKQEC